MFCVLGSFFGSNSLLRIGYAKKERLSRAGELVENWRLSLSANRSRVRDFIKTNSFGHQFRRQYDVLDFEFIDKRAYYSCTSTRDESAVHCKAMEARYQYWHRMKVFDILRRFCSLRSLFFSTLNYKSIDLVLTLDSFVSLRSIW